MSTHRDQHELDSDTADQLGSTTPTNYREKTPSYKSVSIGARSAQTDLRHAPLGVTKFSPHTPSKTPMTPPGPTGRFSIRDAQDFPSFPLERPIKTNKSLTDITKIVDDSMRNRSVEATFIPEDARAVCLTDDFVKYHVNLFKGTDGCILVEVQRRKGCSLSFRKERLALVDALEGRPVRVQNVPVLRIPPELIEEMGGFPTVDEIKAIADNCIGQIHEKNNDAKLIAFQHMASMTDPEKSSADSAEKAALVIMNPTSGADTAILSAIALGKKSSEEFPVMITNACLRIFVNCLKTLSTNGDEYNRIINDAGWPVGELLPLLIDTIHKRHCLHNSHLAMDCICTLLAKSPRILEAVKESANYRNVIEEAVSVGKMNHAKLEKVSKEALRLLG